LTRLSRRFNSRTASLRVLGPAALAATVAVAGCTATTAAPAPSGSAPGGTSALRQCLEQHGVKPPARPPGGAHAPPAGTASSALRKAMQACGGQFGGPDRPFNRG
jgi:hypothetical protein